MAAHERCHRAVLHSLLLSCVFIGHVIATDPSNDDPTAVADNAIQNEISMMKNAFETNNPSMAALAYSELVRILVNQDAYQSLNTQSVADALVAMRSLETSDMEVAIEEKINDWQVGYRNAAMFLQHHHPSYSIDFFNNEMRAPFDRFIQITRPGMNAEQLLRLWMRIAHRIAVIEDLQLEYDENNEWRMIRIDMNMTVCPMDTRVVDAVRKVLTETKIVALLRKLREWVGLEIGLQSVFDIFLGVTQLLINNQKPEVLARYLAAMQHRITLLLGIVGPKLRIHPMTLETFVMVTNAAKETLNSWGLGGNIENLKSDMLAIHQQIASSNLYDEFISYRNKLVKKMEEHDQENAKLLDVQLVSWSTKLNELRTHIRLMKMLIGNEFRINAQLLALVIEIDMMLFRISVQLQTEHFFIDQVSHEDVLKVCYTQLRDYQLMGDRTPEPLKYLNMTAKTKEIRDAIRSETSHFRVYWIYQYSKRNLAQWPGFERSLSLDFQQFETAVEQIFTVPAGMYPNFERWLSTSFLRRSDLQQTNSEVIRRVFQEAPSARWQFYSSLSDGITCEQVLELYKQIGLPRRVAAFHAGYSLDESVRILQLDVFLDTCVPSIAMAVRSTYAGTISANSLMIPLTAKARSDPNLQQTLERITNSIVNFEPSNTIQNRRIFVHHHQCSVIYHFKTYPKETFKYSVKMLKRLLLLDARLDKTDVSTIYSDSLDMKYHRTMGEILSMLMNELNSIEMLALLQDSVYFEGIKDINSKLRAIVQDAENVKRVENTARIWRVCYDTAQRNAKRRTELEAKKAQLATQVSTDPNRQAELRRIEAILESRNFNNVRPIDLILKSKERSADNFEIARRKFHQNTSTIGSRFGRFLQRFVRHQRMMKKHWNQNLQLSPEQYRLFEAVVRDFKLIVNAVSEFNDDVTFIEIRRYLREMARDFSFIQL